MTRSISANCAEQIRNSIEWLTCAWSQGSGARMHVFMSFACVVLFIVSELGFRLTAITVTGVGWSLAAAFVIAAVIFPIAAYFHEKGRKDLRDSVLVIPWCALVAVLTPLPLLFAARIRMPLGDSLLQHWESGVGFTTVGVIHWARSLSLFGFFEVFYRQTLLYLLIAVFLPAALNKREAKVFVIANAIALYIGLLGFAILPIIGPWRTEHFLASPLQLRVEHTLLALRSPGRCEFSLLNDQLGIVGFPSFHTIWAVLCTAALWGFKRLRPLLVLISLAIIISTITTGWHYILDAVGGVLTAVIALIGANSILGSEPDDCGMREETAAALVCEAE